MATYKLEVTTGNLDLSGTLDHIFITLFGEDGESERTELEKLGSEFVTGTTGTYTINTSSSLGNLLLVKIEKDPALLFVDDEWFCSKIVVTTPEGESILFPCYRWISKGEVVELRGGKAMKVYEDTIPLLIEHRQKQLKFKKDLYTWRTLAEGLSDINGFTDESELPAELQFSDSKSNEIVSTKMIAGTELTLKGMLGSDEDWKSLDDMKRIFSIKKTEMSEYVAEHWIEDEFYGYQFLNGVNPNLITKCSELPTNFPVTEEMVQPFLEGSSLECEMAKGNIFIYDLKKMEGLPVRDYEGEPLHVTPGICLLYVNSKKNLVPIAIQLHQEPSEENPIFLPSDSVTDWLLAKIFIKNADALTHQAVTHLMRTHFMAEVYIVAALRCLPEIHPIYKLLFPHFRYTLHINTGGRKSLFGPDGALRTSSLGYDGIIELMRRSLAQISYSSFLLPENITARGLDCIPNNRYRDDGLKLWSTINSFVKDMVEYYYPTDDDVRKDTELQEWISEIFTHAVLGNKESGFPTCFNTAEEVITFITMFIFTASGQHSAVNNPQYDYCSLMPNYSLLLRKPPPTAKGVATKETILETLPNIGEAVSFATMAVVLTGDYTDKVFLGNYPDERFDEPAPKKIIEEFQANLANLTKEIEQRNAGAECPYIYMDPTQMENSIAI